ncbi:MAG: hypothetical protein ABI238_01015 [Terrimesophilobacter sp.]
MSITLDQAEIARVLEGAWAIGASNILYWVDGTRRDTQLTFTVASVDPLVFLEEQAFTASDGKGRRIALTNRYIKGEFISKGRRILATMSRWSIGGMGADGTILVIRMTHAQGGQDGLLVIVRKDARDGELRATIAKHSERFGLGPEDFASLSWLPESG